METKREMKVISGSPIDDGQSFFPWAREEFPSRVARAFSSATWERKREREKKKLTVGLLAASQQDDEEHQARRQTEDAVDESADGNSQSFLGDRARHLLSFFVFRFFVLAFSFSGDFQLPIPLLPNANERKEGICLWHSQAHPRDGARESCWTR